MMSIGEELKSTMPSFMQFCSRVDQGNVQEDWWNAAGTDAGKGRNRSFFLILNRVEATFVDLTRTVDGSHPALVRLGQENSPRNRFRFGRISEERSSTGPFCFSCFRIYSVRNVYNPLFSLVGSTIKCAYHIPVVFWEKTYPPEKLAGESSGFVHREVAGYRVLGVRQTAFYLQSIYIYKTPILSETVFRRI